MIIITTSTTYSLVGLTLLPTGSTVSSMSEPIVLSLDECVRLNERLIKCIANKQRDELLDIIDALGVSEVKGKLKVLASLKLALAPALPSGIYAALTHAQSFKCSLAEHR